ncbi:MAG TPA: response regulator [Polyangia bacterium]|nr:response regulator [Polyangia bacterium]
MAARILIVDDSSVMHAYHRQVLSGLPDCRLSFARHGQEALAKIEEEGAPAVIVLDINMPVMDGLEFLRRLRALSIPRASVIIVSTEGKDDDLQRGLEAGADGYVRKPFKPKELQDLVRRFLATPARTDAAPRAAVSP